MGDLDPDDILHGAKEIADQLGLEPGRVYKLHERGDIPTFRMGGSVCARRSILIRHIAEQENRATDRRVR